MKLPQWLREHLPPVLIAGLSGLFLYFGGQVFHSAAGPFLQHILPAIPNTLLLSLCSLQSLAVILLAVWVVYLHRSHREPTPEMKLKQFDDQFVFVQELGLWKHRAKDGYFCPTCKAKQRESQMGVEERGWRCPDRACKHFQSNPDYKEPERMRHVGKGWPL